MSESAALDARLLPARANYTRNKGCQPIKVKMPPSTHSAVEGNSASPKPADMPLSQGDNAICFAYATADMISQRLGAEISALDVAMKYYFGNPSSLERSTDLRLRRYLQKMHDYKSTIAESRARTDVSVEANPRWLPYADKLEGGEEDVAALLYNISGVCKDRDLPSYDGYTHFSYYLSFVRARMRLFPAAGYSTSDLAGAAPALRSPETDAFNRAWIRRVDRQCHRFPPPFPLLPVSYRIATDEASFMQIVDSGHPPTSAQINKMFSMVDYAIDHGRAPAIGYSWYVLEAASPDDTDLAADHSSVIIARRKLGRTCQYRVQDNTGEYCGRMRKGVRERCENGRIWLTEEELKRTLYSVTYLR